MSFWTELRDSVSDTVSVVTIGALTKDQPVAPAGNQTGVQIQAGQYGGPQPLAAPQAPAGWSMNANPGGMNWKMILPLAAGGLALAYLLFRRKGR